MVDTAFDSLATNIFYSNRSSPSSSASGESGSPSRSGVNLYDTVSNIVKLVSQEGSGSSTRDSYGGIVLFESMPEIEESGATIYASLDDIRAPASILIYLGSPARSFNINHKFISRTVAEANKAFKYVAMLKAWRMPRKSFSGAMDATPETLKLYGYGQNLNGIPTAIQNLNISMPLDCDYITSDYGPVPIVWPVSISLKEMHSYNDMKAFNYDQYKSGNLRSW